MSTPVSKLAVAVDVLFASIFWNKPNCTISALCGLALRKDPNVRSFNGYLGRLLNKIQPDHCENAITADWQRAKETMEFLS